MALNRKGGRWPGGYVSVGVDGTQTFVIEREVGGERFHISTRTHGLRAAMKALERFEADPRAYKEGGVAGSGVADSLRLTVDLVADYHRWMLTRPHPATPKHAREMLSRLADWAEDLGGMDLRKVTLRDHLRPALERRSVGRQHRIIAIKGFYAWLRKERGLLTTAEDATLDLSVPQASPEKHRRRKAVPAEHVRAALARLPPAYRDCLLLLANVGWHTSELGRFVRDDHSRIAPGAGEVLAVLQVRHKTGDTTRTPLVKPEAVAAAERLRARRVLPRKMNEALAAACDAAGVPRFTFGVLRHSVATWAIEAGTPADQVAEFLGHKSKSTTLRFYADVAVPSVTVKLPDF